MNYKHTTFKYTIEGMSPRKIIKELEKNGYESLYSNTVIRHYKFLKKENPFNKYDKIKIQDEEIGFTTHTYRYIESDWIDRDEYLLGMPFSFGDLFRYKDDDTIYSLHDSSSGDDKTLWFSCWNNKDIDLSENLEQFITTVLKITGCDKSLTDIIESDTFEITHNRILEELKEYNLNEAIFSEKKSTFELLYDDEIKNILIDFNKKGNILISEYLENIEDEEEKERIGNIMDFLVGQNLLNKELIVICKETGQWWNVTIPSLDEMKDIEKLNLTCTTCGKKISDESVDELFKINENGKKLVSGSYWMVGKVVYELLKYNIRENDIFINVTLNGEEIDIITLYMGDIIIFELKDKEFGLGDAYKFHGKVSRLSEKITTSSIYPVVISTKSIASEASKLLDEVTGRKWKYKFIDSIENMSQIKTEILDEIIKSVINIRINNVTGRFPAVFLQSTI